MCLTSRLEFTKCELRVIDTLRSSHKVRLSPNRLFEQIAERQTQFANSCTQYRTLIVIWNRVVHFLSSARKRRKRRKQKVRIKKVTANELRKLSLRPTLIKIVICAQFLFARSAEGLREQLFQLWILFNSERSPEFSEITAGSQGTISGSDEFVSHEVSTVKGNLLAGGAGSCSFLCSFAWLPKFTVWTSNRNPNGSNWFMNFH